MRESHVVGDSKVVNVGTVAIDLDIGQLHGHLDA